MFLTVNKLLPVMSITSIETIGVSFLVWKYIASLAGFGVADKPTSFSERSFVEDVQQSNPNATQALGIKYPTIVSIYFLAEVPSVCLLYTSRCV